jgi:hypothetical protein
MKRLNFSYPLADLDYDEARNVLFFRVKQGIEVDVKEIQDMIAYAKEVMGEKRHYCVVDFGSNVMSTTEARAVYAASEYILQNRIADAFLVKSLAVRLVANFFIQVTKPKVKTRLFTDESLALQWLLQQKDPVKG